MSDGAELSRRLHAADLIEALGDLVYELSPQAVFLSCYGEPHERVIGRRVHEVLPREVADAFCHGVREALARGIRVTFEYSLPVAGEAHYYEAQLVPSDRGNAYAIVRDIHARRTAENQLRESEERFRLMADQAPVLLWKANREADCDFFNRGWLEFTGRSLEQELGLRWAEGVHPEDFQRCAETFLESFVARKPFRMEYRLRRADGQYRVLLDQGAPRFDADGSFAGFVGSCMDVTEMREASERISALNAELQQRVRERDALLREIHHRVKNNLQLISSILSLQARLLDGAARGLIEEGQTRVHAIALAHERLCESEDMTDVDLAAYANGLVRLLRGAIGDSSRIAIEIEGQGIRVGADQAIPCGLIMNELITNAFKHAFPGGRSGQLRIALRRCDDERIQLELGDDGIGLPPEVDLRAPATLGLDLVVTLAGQLRGSLEVLRARGTTYSLTFPLARSRHEHRK